MRCLRRATPTQIQSEYQLAIKIAYELAWDHFCFACCYTIFYFTKRFAIGFCVGVARRRHRLCNTIFKNLDNQLIGYRGVHLCAPTSFNLNLTQTTDM